MVVGIWNFFDDEAISPVIRLAREYKSAKFLCGSGTLSADRAILEDIPPYAFRGIVLKKINRTKMSIERSDYFKKQFTFEEKYAIIVL